MRLALIEAHRAHHARRRRRRALIPAAAILLCAATIIALRMPFSHARPGARIATTGDAAGGAPRTHLPDETPVPAVRIVSAGAPLHIIRFASNDAGTTIRIDPEPSHVVELIDGEEALLSSVAELNPGLGIARVNGQYTILGARTSGL